MYKIKLTLKTRIIRRTCGHIRLNMIRNEITLQKIGVTPIDDEMRGRESDDLVVSREMI